MRLWDCKSQSTKPIQVLEEARDSVSTLQVVGHEICTGSVDGRVRVYDLRMGMVYVDVVGRMSPPPSFPTDSSIRNANLLSALPEPVTSLRQTKDTNGLLISTLDSTIRLLDKGNGALLQAYKGHVNKDFRIRSCFGINDAFVVSGSEDGKIYVWDMLEGKVVKKLDGHAGKVTSAVAVNDVRKEWLSAGVDGMCLCSVMQNGLLLILQSRHRADMGTQVV